MANHILLVGASLVDTKGKPVAGLEPGTSNTAEIRTTRGGTARNVAENLARLGADTLLITAVGDDPIGAFLMQQTAEAGVGLDYALTVSNQPTGVYMAILDEDGRLSVALDDVRVMTHITPGYLNNHRALFRDADMIMMDGSLTDEAMDTIIRLAQQYQVPVIADPSSARLAANLRPYLPYLDLVVPNEMEAAVLCAVAYEGPDPETSLALARQLANKGVARVVVTLSDYGLAFVTEDGTGTIPPSHRQFVDSTGTGDAVTAAIMVGLQNDLPDSEAIRLGAAAAALTLQTDNTVVADLSLDMLYHHLIV